MPSMLAAVAVHLSCKRLSVRYRASWSRGGAVVGLMLGTIRPVIVVVCGVVCGGRVAPVVLCMVD